jgi:predicted TIM-barrel fold metal-dependent hydrolase
MLVPVVIDHLGLLPGPGRALDGMRERLRTARLDQAPERATHDPDGPEAAAVARALLAAPDRTVWASDWPHTTGVTGGTGRSPVTKHQVSGLS